MEKLCSSKLVVINGFYIIDSYKLGYHKTLRNNNFRWKYTNKNCMKLDVHDNLISDPTSHTPYQ